MERGGRAVSSVSSSHGGEPPLHGTAVGIEPFEAGETDDRRAEGGDRPPAGPDDAPPLHEIGDPERGRETRPSAPPGPGGRPGAGGSCSAGASMSAATRSGAADRSATITTSLGPAMESMSTWP